MDTYPSQPIADAHLIWLDTYQYEIIARVDRFLPDGKKRFFRGKNWTGRNSFCGQK